MTYFVGWADGQSAQFDTFDAALAEYRQHREPKSLGGPGYDCDCDENGQFVVSDGLTDEERERMLEA